VVYISEYKSFNGLLYIVKRHPLPEKCSINLPYRFEVYPV
jgi:hypothetical protein